MTPCLELKLDSTNPIISPPQYTPSEWLPMASESEADATGVPWLLSAEWTPGKPTGRGRRLTMPPKKALEEIRYIFSRLYHSFCDSMPLKFEDDGPTVDWAYVETRHYMMKLQALWDELNVLRVSSEDEDDKQGLAMTIRGAILKVEGRVKQKRALALSGEEHSKIYRRVQAEQRARKAQATQLGCLIA
ncbi:hypothetical protein B0J17DRAFT_625672 [Rhizoctonia solani]|nr:hypothetical protein B0J17DRAFT_625672 [Rhizoctonia solani]